MPVAAIGAVAAVAGSAMSARSQRRGTKRAAQAQERATNSSIAFEREALAKNLELQRENTDKSLQFQRDSLNDFKQRLDPYRQMGLNNVHSLQHAVNSLPQSANFDASNNALNQMQQLTSTQGQKDFINNDPILKYATDEALNSINNSMAASGKLGSGQAVKAAQQAVTGLAENRINNRLSQLNNQFTNNFNLDSTQFNAGRTVRGDRLAALSDLVNMGQNSAAMTGSASMKAGQNMGSTLTNMANNQSNAIANNANSMANMLTNMGNAQAASQMQQANAKGSIFNTMANLGGMALGGAIQSGKLF